LKWVVIALAMAFAAECYTSLDMKSNTCHALCRRDEYAFGYYEAKSDSCVCANRFKWREYTKQVLGVRGMPASEGWH